MTPSGIQRLSFTSACNPHGKLYTFLPAAIARSILPAAYGAVINCGMWNLFVSVIGVGTINSTPNAGHLSITLKTQDTGRADAADDPRRSL